MAVDSALGGGYVRHYPGWYGRDYYRDRDRYQSQVEQAEIHKQQAVEMEQLHLERERIRQEEETNRKALEKGILPPRYREHPPESREDREPEEKYQGYEAPHTGEKREMSPERTEEIQDLESIARAFRVGLEDGKEECEAAQRYGSTKTPVLTEGRWAQLTAEHDKPNSPHYLKGFRQGWKDAGGVFE